MVLQRDTILLHYTRVHFSKVAPPHLGLAVPVAVGQQVLVRGLEAGGDPQQLPLRPGSSAGARSHFVMPLAMPAVEGCCSSQCNLKEPSLIELNFTGCSSMGAI